MTPCPPGRTPIAKPSRSPYDAGMKNPTPDDLEAIKAYRKELRKEYGRRIKAARLKKGWDSVTEAAKAAGMGRTILANMEAGRFAPTMETLDRLVSAWKIDPKDLLKGPDHRTPDPAPK